MHYLMKPYCKVYFIKYISEIFHIYSTKYISEIFHIFVETLIHFSDSLIRNLFKILNFCNILFTKSYGPKML